MFMCVYFEGAEDATKMGEENVVERLPLAWLIKTVLEGVASTSCCRGPLYTPFVL